VRECTHHEEQGAGRSPKGVMLCSLPGMLGAIYRKERTYNFYICFI
jgi:hypothetical protein